MTGAPPGRSIARGRLRVDAARALEKLREFQLARPEGWVLEVVRAAIAAGATQVSIDGDADDVRVAWSGRAPDAARLTRVLDELVSPEVASERPMRLLATAVNSALAGARFVDLYAIEGGAARRVRYTPDLVRAGSDADPASALRSLAYEEVATPDGAPPDGAVVHLRRRLGLATLRALATGAEPPELSLARGACDDAPIPIRVGAGFVSRESSARDLLRVPLAPPLDGFVALTFAPDPSAPIGATIHAAELGVVLVEAAFRPRPVEEPHVAAPLRLFLDAERMPTNISRSEVRWTEAPFPEAFSAADAAVREVIRIAARELGPRAKHAWTPERLAYLRESALALVSAAAGGPSWPDRCAVALATGSPLAPLLDARLVHDAYGRLQPIAHFVAERSPTRAAGATGGAPPAWIGAAPLDPESHEGLAMLVWAPSGDPARRLWTGHEPARADDLVTKAKIRAVARKRFLRHAERELSVPARDGTIASIRLPPPQAPASAVPDSLFDRPGLAGEVALRGGSGGSITMLHLGREIHRATLDAVPGFDAIATADDLSPRTDYRGLVADAAQALAEHAVLGGVVRAVEAALATNALPAAIATATVLGAIGMASSLFRARGAPSELARAAVLASPLGRAPVVPIVGRDQALSRLGVAELVERAEAGRVLRTTRSVPAGRVALPDVAVLSEAEARTVADLLANGTTVVRYRASHLVEDGRDVAMDLARERLAEGGVVLAVREQWRRGAVGWAPSGSSQARLSHRRTFLGAVPIDVPSWLAPARLTIDVDDDRAMVPPGFPAHVATEQVSADVPMHWHAALLRAVASALLGEDVPDLLVDGATIDEVPIARGCVLEAIAACSDQEAKDLFGDALIERLPEAPLFERLGARVRVSASALADAHPIGSAIPFTPPGSAPSAGQRELRPVVCTPHEALALALLSGRPVVEASEALASRVADSMRAAALERHRQKPVEPLGPKWARVARAAVTRRSGFVGVHDDPRGGSHIRLFVEQRLALERRDPDGPPLEAALDVAAELFAPDLRALTAEGERHVARVLADAGRRILAKALEGDPTVLARDRSMRSLAIHFAKNLGRDGSKRGTKLRKGLASAPLFATIRGDVASVRDATRDGLVWIARRFERWIEPAPNEPESDLDRLPILAIAADDVATALALGALAEGRTLDVTDRARALQRRRAPELLDEDDPWPVIGVDPRLARRVRDLAPECGVEDEVARWTGHVALSPLGFSILALSSLGQHVSDAVLNVAPAVRAEIDAPELAAAAAPAGLAPADRARVERIVGALAARLLSVVTSELTERGEPLPGWLAPSAAPAPDPDPPEPPPRRPASALAPEPRRDPPLLDASALALARVLHEAGATSVRVTVDRTSKRPLVTTMGRGHVRVGGGAPSVAALEAALDARDPRAGSALALLAAHVAGTLNRANDEITDAEEEAVVLALLRAHVGGGGGGGGDETR